MLIIDDEGLLRTRLILKNEYGIRIGSLSYDNFSDTHGTVEIEDIRFRFIIQHKPTPQLEIYKGRDLIYNFQLSFDEKDIKEIRNQSASSIIVVCWYLFLKYTATEKAIFNEAVLL